MKNGTSPLRHGQLEFLLYKVDPTGEFPTRKVYAYYHPNGVVTFELMPGSTKRKEPYQALLRTSANGKLHLLWIDYPREPETPAIRKDCRDFLTGSLL